MGEYHCNCGQTFPSHLARVAHASTCSDMQEVVREWLLAHPAESADSAPPRNPALDT